MYVCVYTVVCVLCSCMHACIVRMFIRMQTCMDVPRIHVRLAIRMQTYVYVWNRMCMYVPRIDERIAGRQGPIQQLLHHNNQDTFETT